MGVIDVTIGFLNTVSSSLQEKLAAKKKLKKEREALGDKVKHSVAPAFYILFMLNHSSNLLWTTSEVSEDKKQVESNLFLSLYPSIRNNGIATDVQDLVICS